jgi:hypothetical protein
MSGAMPRRVFTVAEVNRLIPSLERIFTDVVQLHGAVRRVEKELNGLGVKMSRKILSGDDNDGSPAIRRAKAVWKGTYEALLEAVGQVAALGGEVKDLESGLVDFPGERGSDEIFLCWILGEKRITHWHPIDSGFSGRRPIDHLVPLGPSPLD